MILEYIQLAIDAATPYLVGMVALAFALGLVALWREKRCEWWRVLWFFGHRPLQRAEAILTVILFTLWGGAKPDGGDRGDGNVPTQPPTQGEVPRSGDTNEVEVSTLCFMSISVVSNTYADLSVVWPEDLFDGGAILDFFSKTNLLEKEWCWIGGEEILPGETNLEVSVALAALTDGTNAPVSAFFNVRERASCNQTMADRDGDGIPDIYELYNGTNPYVPDAAAAPRLNVGASGDYATISDALAASTNYSIISLAPETFVEASSISMPSHPVMLVCEDGYAVVRSHAPIGAFVFANGQDARTLLRGIYVVLEARSGYQAAFWCGGSLPWSGAPAAPSFEDIRIRAPYPEPLYYGWHFYRYMSGAATIRRCTINAAGATSMTGIYSFEGPPLVIGDCTAVNFPHDAALYLQSSVANYGGMSAAAEITVEGLALDQSFTNAYMLARFEQGTNFVVSLNRAIMPELPQAPHVPDFMENVCVTNAGLSWNGFALPGSAARDLAIGDIRAVNFSATADTDGDGISDYDEAYVYGSDPWLADSDGDGLSDGDEVGWGTNPLDLGDYRATVSLSVTNAAGLSGNIELALYADAEPYANPPVFSATFQTDATNRLFMVPGVTVTNAVSCALVAFNDLDADGQRGMLERCVTNSFSLSSGDNAFNISLPKSILDNDDDDIPDIWEYAHGLSWTNALDATEDNDLDYLPNAQEYLFDCNPFVDDSSNIVFAVASRSIDERIAGKNPTNALPVFLNYPSCGTNLVRNTECWAYGLDLSCASPWNSYDCNRMYAATAISSRHVILATHHTPEPLPQQYFFVGTNSNVYCRSIVATRNVGADVTVALLDSDLPATVRPAKVLPQNYEEYIGSGECLPMVLFDQYEKAYIFEVSSLFDSCIINQVVRHGVLCQNSSNAIRSAFKKAQLISGDSGNPRFFIVGNEVVLIGLTWASNGFGENLARLVPQLQAAMDSLVSGYQLQLYDFSSHKKKP